MKYTKLEIPDVILIEPTLIGDDRGYFSESFRLDKLEEVLGYSVSFCQDNESLSTNGVLRGLHYQLPPHAQSKLARVSRGEVLDVAVDIRRGSPYFGKYVTVILSESNKKQLFVPRGFAHGFVVLSESAIFNYKVDNYYSQKFDRGINFEDEEIAIDWGLDSSELKVSSKDLTLAKLSEAELFNFSENLYE
jgi:dTDP-4-dehydrorhamnose 3,5-epimerase